MKCKVRQQIFKRQKTESNGKKLTQLTVFANHAKILKTFDIVLQPMDLAMDDKTANTKNKKNISSYSLKRGLKRSCIHELYKTAKVHKCLATNLEVRSFRKSGFSRLNLSLSDR